MATRRIVHRSPWGAGEVRWSFPGAGEKECRQAVAGAEPAGGSFDFRKRSLERLAEALRHARGELAELMAIDVGKPVAYGGAEVDRAVSLLCAAARSGSGEVRLAEATVLRRPLGVVALITAFNNPVAVPVGKIAPALLYGNAVVWKPAPAGAAIAERLVTLASGTGLPVQLVHGGPAAAAALASDPQVAAVSLTGGEAAGLRLRRICARRGIPFQGELGGNNAAIVWSDADLEQAARLVAEGAFGCAGQRCTANRRVIVEQGIADSFLDHLQEAARRLTVGMPLDPEVAAGPLVSRAARSRVAGVVERARSYARRVISVTEVDQLEGAFFPPTIVCTDDRRCEVVQEETFGPVLVVQRAESFEHALALNNGVRQGLVAALFTASEARRNRFLERAEAGILKIGRSTVDAGVEAPFGGWKSSGFGPPEHGSANLDFYTQSQTIYSPGEEG